MNIYSIQKVMQYKNYMVYKKSLCVENIFASKISVQIINFNRDHCFLDFIWWIYDLSSLFGYLLSKSVFFLLYFCL